MEEDHSIAGSALTSFDGYPAHMARGAPGASDDRTDRHLPFFAAGRQRPALRGNREPAGCSLLTHLETLVVDDEVSLAHDRLGIAGD